MNKMHQQEFKIIVGYENINRIKWSEFVASHPDGTIFQTPEYYEIHQNANGFQPYVLAISDKKDQVCGIMVAIISRVYGGVLGYFTSRAVIAGGPLVKDNDTEVALILLNAYLKNARSKVIYSQFRNLFNVEYIKPAFNRIKAKFEDHLNILIDLRKDEDELWKGVKSRKRNNIRQAQRKGLIVKQIIDLKEVDLAYSILTEVYERAKLPLADKSLFDNAFKTMHDKGMLRIYGTYQDEQLAGAMFILAYNGRFYDWYAGSFRKYYSYNPNDIIPWEIFKLAKEDNVSLFDFGGAGKPGVPYGVRDYKIQFGGELVNFGRYELPHNRFVFSIMKMAFKIWQLFN